MTDVFIIDKDGNQANATDVTVPSDRFFRDAWSLSGNVITEDLAVAKEMFRDKIREVRKPLLEALDASYMKALETSTDTTQIVADKQALRDAPAASAIDAATTIDELKAAWDTTVLGASPYA
jgi:hypothetical protein